MRALEKYRWCWLNLALLLVLAQLHPLPAHAEWFPSKPVEFIVMAGKGGGADKMARLFKKIIDWEELSPFPFVPINKPGGSGAEAMTYLKKKTGDPHVVMITLNSFYTTPLRNPKLKINALAYTPIARMAEDTFLLWVHVDSKIKTLNEFISAVKAKGRKWIMAGTGTASEDNLLTDVLNATYGLQITYRPFKGGGRVAKELATKKADSTVNNPAEQESHHKAGKTRPLAAFTPDRLQMFGSVPTFREKGHNLVYFMQRSIVGPPGISNEAALFYQDLFRQVYESKEWQDYMNQKSLRGGFLTGKNLRSYWAREQDIHRKLLIKMGKIN